MRVVIVGVGEIGSELAKDFAKHENSELVIIDSDEKRCNEVAAEIDGLVIHGDATHPDILKKAQLSDADALVAATGIDAINTVIAMLAHRFEVEKIIVKLSDDSLRSACQEIGVSRVITPKISAVAEIMSVLYDFAQADFSLVERRGLRLIELEVGEARGKKMSEIELPKGAHVVAIQRAEEISLPEDKTTLEEGDELLLLVENEKVVEKIKGVLNSAN